MSEYIEHNGKIAFHPGYYIKEIVEDSGLTQEDFARRLDTTPKNLSILLRGEQNLSVDMAMKLSKMLGTSIGYWLNLQSSYDTLIAEFESEKEFENERRIFSYLNYGYFRDNFGLPALPRNTKEQIAQVRKFLGVSTLSVFARKDLAVSFRSADSTDMSESNIVKANIMVQIAVNKALKTAAPVFNKHRFEKAAGEALSMTLSYGEFYPVLYSLFLHAGVIFIILPNIKGSKTNGATKRIGSNVMLMVNDRRLNSDSFWFTLYHEIGHIINGDYGISFEGEVGSKEDAADEYAQNMLIPAELYSRFIASHDFSVDAIQAFSAEISRDPAIVLGRLQNDGLVAYDDWRTKSLRHKYKVKIKR